MKNGRKRILVINEALREGGDEKNLISIGKYADSRLFEVSYLLTRSKDMDEGLMVYHLNPYQFQVNRFTWIPNTF